MKKIFLTIIFAIAVVFLFAQNKKDTTKLRPLQNINLSYVGVPTSFAFNYERSFLINPRFFLTGQIGIGYYEEFLLFGSDPENSVTIPHHFTGNWGKGKHLLEFGLCGFIIPGNTGKHYVLGPIVGYRFQPLKSNKVNFRIFGSIPVIGFDNNIYFAPVGISVGFVFN